MTRVSDLNSARQTLAVNPANAVALHHIGVDIRDRRHPERARLFLSWAFNVNPQSEMYLSDLLYTRYFTGDRSVTRELAALSRRSKHPHASRMFALLLADMRQVTASIHESARAVTLDPTNVVSYSKRAITLILADKIREAETSLSRALLLHPNWLEASINYAHVLSTRGDYQSALKMYETIIKDKPDLVEPYFNASVCLLGLGLFQEGWRWYEYRWRMNSIVSFAADFRLCRLKSNKPEFDGKTVDRLLVWGEQGIGDEIMFASIINDTVASTSKLIIACDPRLCSLFSRSFPNADVVSAKEKIGETRYDAQVSVGGLAKIYRNHESMFIGKTPYLIADKRTSEQLGKRLVQSSRLKIGLSWRSINADNGKSRSITLKELFGHLGSLPVAWVNLQYDFNGDDRQQIKDFPALKESFFEFPDIDKMRDMESVAALIDQCDLVISIGNTVAHLAGALGKPMFVLVPAGGSWRWAGAGSSTPWYPTARVFRKKSEDEWAVILSEIVPMIRDFYRLANSQ